MSIEKCTVSREAGSCEVYRTEQDPEGRTVMLRRKNAGASWHSAKGRKRAKRKSETDRIGKL